MNPIGTIQAPVITPPVTSSPAPAPPPPSSPGVASSSAGSAFDPVAAEQRRAEAVRQAASNSDVFVVSDRKFTIFKDTNGQYVTRFVSLRDGRVTYIPEPELLRRASSSAPLVTIKA